jgi:predicted metal-dependent phosphoesterase TrpH
VKSYRADLHIHTVLSPCADREMLPSRVVAQALARGLSMVGICDHNSARNTEAVRRAAGDSLRVIAGIEITTSEEVHLLGLFPRSAAAAKVSKQVRATLPPQGRPLSWMGPQAVVDSRDRFRDEETTMLSGASRFSLAMAIQIVHGAGGLAVAAHVDRPSFSVTSQLGFIPLGIGLDALEVSAAGVRSGAAARLATIGLPLISSSDSHCLDQIGEASTLFDLSAPTFTDLSLAFKGREGRSCHLA